MLHFVVASCETFSLSGCVVDVDEDIEEIKFVGDELMVAFYR